MAFISDKQKIIKKFEVMSDKYHQMSLLFHELAGSLRIKSKDMKPKEFKEYVRNELKLDFDKLRELTVTLEDLNIRK